MRVNPTGVSVSSMSATTVFLTYGGLRNERPVDAYWCGELIAAAPGIGTRCDPSTIYGRLPARYDLSQLGAAGGVFTDVMSIPPSVARAAYQAALRGATSTFFYVRRFQNLAGGPDEYVAVTCRLTGGGARAPFSLTDVHLQFDGQDAIPFVAPGEAPPRVAARIAYTGTGRLIGRWEIVLPGEDPPGARDLVTEASLPIDQRSSQRRFTQLERFNIFLPPDGRVTLPGPDPSRLPSAIEGTYQVLLRVEASDDREGDSNLSDAGAGVGIVHSGAVAGFSLPVLRYVVAGEGARTPDASVSAFRLLGGSRRRHALDRRRRHDDVDPAGRARCRVLSSRGRDRRGRRALRRAPAAYVASLRRAGVGAGQGSRKADTVARQRARRSRDGLALERLAPGAERSHTPVTQRAQRGATRRAMTPNVPHLRLVDEQRAARPDAEEAPVPGASSSPGEPESRVAPDDDASRALEHVVSRFDAFIRRSARRHGLSGADVDEVVQELRLRMWRSLGTAELIRRAKASYIYRTAISASIDIIRRRRTRRFEAASDDSVAEIAPDTRRRADSRLDEHELADAVHRAIAMLAESRRAVVRMHLAGYERHEIADLLGWTEAKTRNLLYRGLADLREILESWGIGPASVERSK